MSYHFYGGKIQPKCPYHYQYELVAWAIKRFPKEYPSKFKKMRKRQLYAIWFSSARKCVTEKIVK